MYKTKAFIKAVKENFHDLGNARIKAADLN